MTTTAITTGSPDDVVTVNGTKVWPLPPTPVPAPVETFGARLGFSPGAQYVTGGHDQSADITVVQKAGAKWLRVDCFDLGNATVDAGVKAAVAAGLSVLLIINNKSSYQAGPASFAQTCTTVVKRYAPMGVHAYELTNEPNGIENGVARLPAASYVALLPSAIAAVRAADPSAKVLAGALAPSPEPGFVGYGKAIIDSKATYDALSVHPYCFPKLPNDNDATTATWSSWSKMRQLHDYAVSKGDLRPIWGTEFGAPTMDPNSWTEAIEVQGFTQATAFLKANLWLERIFWFCVRDGAAGMTSFGVVRTDGTEKPVLAAMTAATKT